MEDNVRNNLRKLNRHLGLGDSKSAKLLFVGVEQGGEAVNLSSDIEETPEFDKWSIYENKGQAWSPVWTKIVRVSSNVQGITSNHNYRYTKLFRKNSFEILVDLFPLARPRKSHWSHQGNLTQSEYRDWIAENIEERYKQIRSVQQSMTNRFATICFGKSSWQDHKECLKLDKYQSEVKGEGREQFILYRDARTILTPFFGNGAIKNSLLDEVSRQIKEFEQSNEADFSR